MGIALRELVLRFADDPAWVQGMASELTAAIHRELPQLGADEELARDTYDSTASVIRLFIDSVRHGQSLTDVQPPAAAAALARELVRRGLPIDDLLRAYHIGHAKFFERWVADVRGVLDDPEDVASAVEEAAASTFAFVRALDGGLVRRWAQERDRWIRTAAAAQAETVRSLLAGDERDPATAGAEIGYDLSHSHTAFVVCDPGPTAGRVGDPGRLERAAAAVADAMRGRDRLIVPLRAGIAAGWVDGGDPTLPTGRRQSRQSFAATLVAIGLPAAGLQGFRASHRQALDALRVARLSGRHAGSVVSYATTAVAALASADLERARAFVSAELGSVAGDDDEARRLAGTLFAYLEEGLSPRATARRLGVHENTVVNRVRAVERRLGHPIKPRIAELLVAARLVPLLRSTPPPAPGAPGKSSDRPRAPADHGPVRSDDKGDPIA